MRAGWLLIAQLHILFTITIKIGLIVKKRDVSSNWVDLSFDRVFGQSVLIAGLAQAVMLFAGYLWSVWFSDFVLRRIDTIQYPGSVANMFVMQFPSLFTTVWSCTVLVGITLLVARRKGVRWAATMVSWLLVGVVLVGAAIAAYAASTTSLPDAGNYCGELSIMCDNL